MFARIARWFMIGRRSDRGTGADPRDGRRDFHRAKDCPDPNQASTCFGSPASICDATPTVPLRADSRDDSSRSVAQPLPMHWTAGIGQYAQGSARWRSREPDHAGAGRGARPLLDCPGDRIRRRPARGPTSPTGAERSPGHGRPCDRVAAVPTGMPRRRSGFSWRCIRVLGFRIRLSSRTPEPKRERRQRASARTRAARS
jgi:hypothetical protein